MADVSATLRSWSTLASSNNPSGSTLIGTGLDDNLRQIQATVRQYLSSKGSNMASAATVDLSTADGFFVDITGTTQITGLGTEGAGISYLIRFNAVLTFTYNVTSLILPGGVNITTASGDMALMVSLGSGNWICSFYSKASGGYVLLDTQGTDVASATTLNLDAATGQVVDVTGTTTITAITLAQGKERVVRFTGALTLTNGASLVLPGGANITTAAGDYAFFRGYASSVVRCESYNLVSGRAIVPSYVPVRQTVLSGPVDSAGLPNFGGATGASSVTMSGTLVATSANGFSVGGGVDTIGTGTNLSWSSLTSNGTMYLYATISGGVLTAASTTIAPVYQWGGTPSVTNNTLTFSIQAMTGYLGNGSTAPQTNWVAIGEVLVAANVVSTITWYSLMGRYYSAFTSTLPSASTLVTFNHNLGVYPDNVWFEIENLTTEYGFAVGDRVRINYGSPGIGAALVYPITFNYKSFKMKIMNSGSFASGERLDTGDSGANLTAANWKYRAIAFRSW